MKSASRKFTRLETPRLVIRRFRSAVDLEAFLAYRNDPEVARFQGWEIPYPRNVAADLIRRQSRSDPDDAEGFQFAIALKDSDQLIGDCYLRCRKEDRSGDLGYTIAREYQGQGFASEAVGCVIDYAFREMGLNRIVATTECRNLRSIAMLERLGFRREGHLHQSSVFREGVGWQDEYLYAILDHEWLKHRG